MVQVMTRPQSCDQPTTRPVCNPLGDPGGRSRHLKFSRYQKVPTKLQQGDVMSKPGQISFVAALGAGTIEAEGSAEEPKG
jgi:hypothetical protein